MPKATLKNKNEATAELRYFRAGPRKLRPIVDTIRGRSAPRALNSLTLMNKRLAFPILKLLKSAIANAKHNHQLEAANLRVKSITVDGGPVLKRWMPKAHGRATPVRERTSHVKIVLEQIVHKQKPADKSTKSKITNSK